MVSTTNLVKMENDPKKTLTIEVCVDTVESAIAAQRGGADRIELCGNLIEGGITPSIGAIEMVRKNLSIPLHVVIRPRGGDFLYSDIDFEVMKRDIELVKWLGADGVVFGVLTPRAAVDVERTEDLIARARPLSVTFHRAFDMTRDPYQSLDDLIALGVNRVLTSGQ
ncbi:MAG: copper homeostasis protein CutC, partial [Blastocatellia bacterium]